MQPPPQLKSIILACTELKYQQEQQDIYQLSATHISRLLRQLNENNNRLFDQKPDQKSEPATVMVAPPAQAVAAAAVTTTMATPMPLLSSPIRCQLVGVPVQSHLLPRQPISAVAEVTSNVNVGDRTHQVDHAYSVLPAEGPLRVAGVKDKATVVVVLRGANLTADSNRNGEESSAVVNNRYPTGTYTPDNNFICFTLLALNKTKSKFPNHCGF